MNLPYFLSLIPNKENKFEIHKAGCVRLPSPDNRIFLQEHETYKSAQSLAEKHKENVTTCFYCCIEAIKDKR